MIRATPAILLMAFRAASAGFVSYRACRNHRALLNGGHEMRLRPHPPHEVSAHRHGKLSLSEVRFAPNEVRPFLEDATAEERTTCEKGIDLAAGGWSVRADLPANTTVQPSDEPSTGKI
jgi:hypothetical protein